MNENTNPAATSGDAPDLQQLKALALAAGGVEFHTALGDRAVRYDGFAGSYFTPSKELSRYIAAANPAVVLDLIAHIERTTAHAQPVNTSSERVENAAGNEQVERAVSPAPTAPFAWMKSNEIEGLLNAEETKTFDGEPVRQYGRIYARQYDADMVPVYAASGATASGDELPITDENAPGYRPPCCDGGGLGSLCCSGGVCVADRELAEMGIGRTCATVSAATKPTADLSALKKMVLDVSNTSYRCGQLNAGDEESSEAYAKADAADKAIIEYVQSLLATKPAAAPAVPEGFVIVPKVPTHSMIAKTVDAVFDGAIEDASVIEEVYNAMLAAVPVPCTNSDSWNCKYCRKTATCEALKDERNFGTPAASTIGAAQTADQVPVLQDAAQAINRLLGAVEGLSYVDSAREFGERTLTNILRITEAAPASAGQAAPAGWKIERANDEHYGPAFVIHAPDRSFAVIRSGAPDPTETILYRYFAAQPAEVSAGQAGQVVTNAEVERLLNRAAEESIHCAELMGPNTKIRVERMFTELRAALATHQPSAQKGGDREAE